MLRWKSQIVNRSRYTDMKSAIRNYNSAAKTWICSTTYKYIEYDIEVLCWISYHDCFERNGLRTLRIVLQFCRPRSRSQKDGTRNSISVDIIWMMIFFSVTWRYRSYSADSLEFFVFFHTVKERNKRFVIARKNAVSARDCLPFDHGCPSRSSKSHASYAIIEFLLR